MRIRWYGQSAFLLSGEHEVFIDPFGPDMPWGYPPIDGVEAEVLLVTHEHRDHSAVDVIGRAPHTLRSTAGTLESPLGPVTAVASEHDDVAGTKRGPNTIFRFTLDGLRICHFGDFGQAELRREQAEAIGEIDVVFLPVGGNFTIGGEHAAAIARTLEPRLVIPMHYGNSAVDFLEPPDAFLDALGAPVDRLDDSAFDVELGDELRVVMPAVP